MLVAPTTIRMATAEDLETLTGLFDAYRVFYGRDSDLAGAREFLRVRLASGDSVIFLAEKDGIGVGFTQLYPSLSSASMARIFILNDLFVDPAAREGGVGSALLQAGVAFARKEGAARLTLSTELSNTRAQRLYENAGWKRDNAFCVYNYAL
jgi:GNAT superfamily N-acetyltransferase